MGKLKKKFYEQELENLQIELVKLQEWVKHKNSKSSSFLKGEMQLVKAVLLNASLKN